MTEQQLNVATYRDILEQASGFSAEISEDEFARHNLTELGFDSLCRLEAASRVQQMFDITLEDEEVVSAETAEHFVEIVNQRLEG